MRTLRVKTDRRTQFVDVTAAIEKEVKQSGVASGVCYLYVPHTTAGILVNEHANPDVAADLEAALDRFVPRNGTYRHREGNADSHIKAGLCGTSQIAFIEGGKLALGRWQGIFYSEFDGPPRAQPVPEDRFGPWPLNDAQPAAAKPACARV